MCLSSEASHNIIIIPAKPVISLLLVLVAKFATVLAAVSINHPQKALLRRQFLVDLVLPLLVQESYWEVLCWVPLQQRIKHQQ
jgi:hypothetical protein